MNWSCYLSTLLFTQLGNLLSEDEYQKKIVPCVVKLFSSPDRATRARLLQQVMSLYFFHLLFVVLTGLHLVTAGTLCQAFATWNGQRSDISPHCQWFHRFQSDNPRTNCQSNFFLNKFIPEMYKGLTFISSIQSILFLAPKLNYNNLNVEVLKHFARLQAKDDEVKWKIKLYFFRTAK